jgi:hypothetical protein
MVESQEQSEQHSFLALYYYFALVLLNLMPLYGVVHHVILPYMDISCPDKAGRGGRGGQIYLFHKNQPQVRDFRPASPLT